MADFDYGAPADLFPSRSKRGNRPVGYHRFSTAAEAIRFAIEQMPEEFLPGTVLEVEDERIDGGRIRWLRGSARGAAVSKPGGDDIGGPETCNEPALCESGFQAVRTHVCLPCRAPPARRRPCVS